MTVDAFLTAQMRPTQRQKDATLYTDGLDGFLSTSTTVEAKGNASFSTMSLRNANQVEAVTVVEFTPTCLTCSQGPKFKRPCIISPLLLPIYIVSRFS
jgi:hypothetical protein